MLRRNEATKLNKEKFKVVVSYFYSLYKKGEISERLLEFLIREACANFIETEVEDRIQATLDRQFMQLFNFKNFPLLEDALTGRSITDKWDVSKLLRI